MNGAQCWNCYNFVTAVCCLGITDGLLSLISQRNATRLRDSNGDLASLHSHSGGSEGGGGDESDLESGPLLSSTGSGGTGGGRRRHIHSASREGLGVQGRERASSTSSVASLSAAESSDHQSEVGELCLSCLLLCFTLFCSALLHFFGNDII